MADPPFLPVRGEHRAYREPCHWSCPAPCRKADAPRYQNMPSRRARNSSCPVPNHRRDTRLDRNIIIQRSHRRQRHEKEQRWERMTRHQCEPGWTRIRVQDDHASERFSASRRPANLNRNQGQVERTPHTSPTDSMTDRRRARGQLNSAGGLTTLPFSSPCVAAWSITRADFSATRIPVHRTNAKHPQGDRQRRHAPRHHSRLVRGAVLLTLPTVNRAARQPPQAKYPVEVNV